MFAGFDAVSGGLDADDPDGVIVEERMEQAHGVGAAADAGDHRVRQPAFLLQSICQRTSSPMTALEVAHHGPDTGCGPATVPIR